MKLGKGCPTRVAKWITTPPVAATRQIQAAAGSTGLVQHLLVCTSHLRSRTKYQGLVLAPRFREKTSNSKTLIFSFTSSFFNNISPPQRCRRPPDSLLYPQRLDSSFTITFSLAPCCVPATSPDFVQSPPTSPS
jgi:hypothetical protein